jgi:hypothetical protein
MKAFSAFGDAIGSDNLAVWFAKDKNSAPSIANLDVKRMSKYCAKFGLTPTQTPQVVTLRTFPDGLDSAKIFVSNLNGSADDSANALGALTDELLKTGLNQKALDENGWTSKVTSAVVTFMNGAACYMNKVSFSINVGAVRAEFAHSSDKGC